MISPEKLFENFFDDEKITPPRLSNFAGDTLNRLTAANTGQEYTALIAQLTPANTAFRKEIGDLDTAVGQRIGKTRTLDQLSGDFKKTMSDLEGMIAFSVGGKNTEAYLAFYPRGLSEYSNLSKTTAPVLVNRVKAAAQTHATALGTDVTTRLQAFETAWTSARQAQQLVKGNISDNRADRSVARENTELALIAIIHTIGAKFPGNTAQCLSFFDFGLLTGRRRAAGNEPKGNPGS